MQLSEEERKEVLRALMVTKWQSWSSEKVSAFVWCGGEVCVHAGVMLAQSRFVFRSRVEWRRKATQIAPGLT